MIYERVIYDRTIKSTDPLVCQSLNASTLGTLLAFHRRKSSLIYKLVIFNVFYDRCSSGHVFPDESITSGDL